MRELWKAIRCFPGYEVSSHGRVRSFRKRRGRKTKPSYHKHFKILYPRFDQQSRPGVSLCRTDGTVYTAKIQILVLTAFKGPRKNGNVCCHKDGNRRHNFAQNLKWGTAKENYAHSVTHGTNCAGERHGCALLTRKEVNKIRKLHATHKYPHRVLAKKFSVASSTIGAILRNVTWKTCN